MNRKRLDVFVFLMLTIVLTACAKEPVDTVLEKSTGKIYLYGELHGNKLIYEKELELWKSYYDKQGMRHLFVELPYYTAEFLNLWMTVEDDTILNELYLDWDGTAIHTEDTLSFFKEIKQQCPETIFHGTDVGHQYYTTGERYLAYLKDNGMTESYKYTLAEENIMQGKQYYSHSDDAYRENMLVSNFVREFDTLEAVDVMGIYGAAHTDINANAYNASNVPSMAKQLFERYGEKLYTEDLARNIEAISHETITINEKDYGASYFGKVDLSTILPKYQYREFWLIENAYEDFKDCPTVGNVLPYTNYPMMIEEGQIYLVQYTLTDGSVKKEIHRADGNIWQNMEITEEIIIE